MWAFLCGVVSSGAAVWENWSLLVLGMVLAGPMVCGTSQAVNDWYDRHVDAINEPGRPIPSGRIPGRWGFYIGVAWTGASLALAATLGLWVFVGAVIGLTLAWMYSAPPFRLKLNGWYGNGAVGFSYEGLAWFTGAAVMAQAFPDGRILLLAVLYSIGAHGIMTLNDFKAIEGDRHLGVRTLPVQLGVSRAARLASAVMAAPQAVVVLLLLLWGRPFFALGVLLLLMAQSVLMVRFLFDTRKLMAKPYTQAALYNGTGTTLYVLGMLLSAFAVAPLVGGAL